MNVIVELCRAYCFGKQHRLRRRSSFLSSREMVSKKKAKGKARKAAKALREQAEQQRETSALETQKSGRVKINDAVCYHGYWKEERFVTEFIKAFLDEYNDPTKGRDLKESLEGARKATYENAKYAVVWKDEDKLELVISCFLFVATRHVLNGITQQASVNVCIANYLEQHVACTFRHTQSVIAGPKISELLDADIHTVVSYLRKRIPCSCLDKKYQEVKNIKKMGECCNPRCSLPENRVERSKMLCCTRCRQVNYCSRECQKAAWPTHKANCDRYAFDEIKKEEENIISMIVNQCDL